MPSSNARQIKLKYILSYKTKFGEISAESSNPKNLVGAYAQLTRLAATLRSGKTQANLRAGNEKGGRGSGETATIIREINAKIMGTSFFSRPRTTGEARDRLNSLTGGSFASRKVSQALGLLWKKRALKRMGRKNHYKYSK
jgi:hypothetical protein